MASPNPLYISLWLWSRELRCQGSLASTDWCATIILKAIDFQYQPPRSCSDLWFSLSDHLPIRTVFWAPLCFLRLFRSRSVPTMRSIGEPDIWNHRSIRDPPPKALHRGAVFTQPKCYKGAHFAIRWFTRVAGEHMNWVWAHHILRTQRMAFTHTHTQEYIRTIVSRLYPTPLPRPISIQYSVTWRPTSSLSPCDTTIHLFAQEPISVFVSRYTWYECAAGRKKQSQNLIEKTYSWTCCTTAMTCQGPRIHLSGPATWKWALLGTTLKKKEEERTRNERDKKKETKE